MTDLTETPRPGIARRLPLIAILLVAVLGAVTLRDHLSFEALIGFRDAHLVATALGFFAVSVLIKRFFQPKSGRL